MVPINTCLFNLADHSYSFSAHIPTRSIGKLWKQRVNARLCLWLIEKDFFPAAFSRRRQIKLHCPECRAKLRISHPKLKPGIVANIQHRQNDWYCNEYALRCGRNPTGSHPQSHLTNNSSIPMILGIIAMRP